MFVVKSLHTLKNVKLNQSILRSFSQLQTPTGTSTNTQSYGQTKTNGVDIYLGNLELNITSESLKHAINKRYSGEYGGPRIVFNKLEKKSLGFGYITVPTHEQAKIAIDALTGMIVNDQTVKVDIGQERRIFRAAFFGNLDLSVTEDELQEHIETILKSNDDDIKNSDNAVTKVRLAKTEDGSSRGFAHVDFRESSMRDRALLELNGVELNGRPLKVDKAVLKTRLPVVYVGNISYDVTKEHMEQMLDEIVGRGNYTDIRLHLDKITGKLKSVKVCVYISIYRVIWIIFVMYVHSYGYFATYIYIIHTLTLTLYHPNTLPNPLTYTHYIGYPRGFAHVTFL